MILRFACGAALAAICASAAAGSPDDWEAGYQIRLERLLNAREWPIGPGTSDHDAGKRDWPALLAELWKARGNPARLDAVIRTHGATLVASKWAGSFYRPFSAPGYTLYYARYKDLLPRDQAEAMRQMVRRDGWNFLRRPDHHMDAIYPYTEFNSENFNWMARFAGVYWARELGDEAQSRYFSRFLDNVTRALFAAGRVEWNSNVYWGYTLQGPLVLYETAGDPRIRAQARAVLDWLAVEAALHYIDGQQAGPDIRAKEAAYKPFSGSVWPYAYLWFADERHTAFPDAEAVAHMGVQETGYIAGSPYRPPRVAIEIAQRNFRTPVEIQSAKPFYAYDEDDYSDWDGHAGRRRRFDFETLYLDRDFTLASDATERPDGAAVGFQGQHPFSEQSVWRLAVRGSGHGALQVFGNVGANDTMAGRSPFEEVAQYGNVMVRAIRGADRLWVAVPKAARVAWRGDSAFLDLGHGVYAALRPFAAKGASSRDWTDPGYAQLIWTYDASLLGGLALEAGAPGESFERFQARVMRERGLETDAQGRLRYRSLAAKTLTVEFTPPGSYSMSDGSVIAPAGKLPRVWRDGVLDDYTAWDTYRVRSGEALIDQRWGGDRLSAKAGGATLDIRVDPATGAIQ